MNFFATNKNNSQAGVTLLLSIVILSGLTLITVTIATFAIQELRASRAIIATEPAIAAAESAGEKGLWSVKRGNILADCSNPDTQILTNNTLLNTCKSYDEATFDVNGGIPFIFYLYNPDDINGDIDLNSCTLNANNSTQCFSELSIEHISGSGSLNIDVTRVDGSITGITPSSPAALTAGEDVDINITGVTSGTEGRIKVTLNSSSDVTVKVNTDRGMPTFPTIEAFACSSRGVVSTCSPSSGQELFNRRINITVPELTGSFGSASPTPPPPGGESANCTRGSSVTDSTGGVWTFGPGNETLRNGVHMGGGLGTIYKYVNSVVWVLGQPASANVWFEWGGSWAAGGSEPACSGSPTPPPAPLPPPPPPPATSATFVTVNNTTLGNWRGVYGVDGKAIANHITSYPSYASVSITNALTFTWADPSTDARALRKNTGNQRIASTWYNTGTFSFNVNITDSNTHQVGLYMLDYDNLGRTQTIEVIDAATSAVLDSKTVSSMTGGVYYIWNIRGNVRFQITQTGTQNAIVSGIFFD